MPNDTVTIAFEGRVVLHDFAEAMNGFRGLLDGLTKVVAERSEVEWALIGLEPGSATVTARGESRDQEAVEHIAEAYLTVGRSLVTGGPVPYGKTVRRHAEQITDLLNGRITGVRFQTLEDDAIVRADGRAEHRAPILSTAYGAIEGRVQGLSSRQGLRFTLYDALFDRAVSCYLQEGREEIMREAWGRRATVNGVVRRDTESGHPLGIRQITAITILEDPVPGQYRRARAIRPLEPGEPMPEEMVRRVRDG